MKKEIDKYKFISEDGKIFNDEESCKNYEQFINDLKCGKEIMKSNPCVAVYVNEQINLATQKSYDCADSARQSCGYDSWIDESKISESYDILTTSLYKLQEKFRKFIKEKTE